MSQYTYLELRVGLLLGVDEMLNLSHGKLAEVQFSINDMFSCYPKKTANSYEHSVEFCK